MYGEIIDPTQRYKGASGFLERLYSDNICLSVVECAVCLSLIPVTIYNGISSQSSKPFPSRPVRIGGKLGFLILNIGRFLAKR